MTSYQEIQIIGRLGFTPELRYTPKGAAVTRVNVATNRSYSGADGARNSSVCWFRVEFWNKTAEEFTKYAQKGRLVFIRGRMQPGEDGHPRLYNHDGGSKAWFDVTALSFMFLDRVEDRREPNDFESGDSNHQDVGGGFPF